MNFASYLRYASTRIIVSKRYQRKNGVKLCKYVLYIEYVMFDYKINTLEENYIDYFFAKTAEVENEGFKPLGRVIKYFLVSRC